MKLYNGTILVIREDIRASMISTMPSKGFEGFFVELNFQKKKSLLYCNYSSHESNISSPLISLRETLDIQLLPVSWEE